MSGFVATCNTRMFQTHPKSRSLRALRVFYFQQLISQIEWNEVYELTQVVCWFELDDYSV